MEDGEFFTTEFWTPKSESTIKAAVDFARQHRVSPLVKDKKAGIVTYWSRANRKSETAYFPDLGPPPDCRPEDFEPVDEVDLAKVPDGTLVTFRISYGYSYTGQIKDGGKGKWLRLWGSSPKNLASEQGHGYAILFEKYGGLHVAEVGPVKKDKVEIKQDFVLGKKKEVNLPYFVKRSGPKGLAGDAFQSMRHGGSWSDILVDLAVKKPLAPKY